ncbi:lysM domain receptor-like kinase 3 [Impatiens glandulifera]|uniref:lysM domain receptor-like kinase 3 n=1 Tax=Impatiens glandulifera TaxID=253017 RepID=UPI001FB0C111|nr:lysM domain receptor-like kinase 3 [Impatiens glandulifera]
MDSNATQPLSCNSGSSKICPSLLYQNNNLTTEKIASLYLVSSTFVKPINNGKKKDYLVSVPCSCKEVNGTLGSEIGYFYDTLYQVQHGDTFENVAIQDYSGQALEVGGENNTYIAGKNATLHILCGCVAKDSQVVVTYTVQEHDILSDIAIRLSTTVQAILDLNTLVKDSGFIEPGWVLFVPMEKNGIPPPDAPTRGRRKERHKWMIIVIILSIVALFSLCALVTVLVWRNKWNPKNKDPKSVMAKNANKSYPLQDPYLHKVKTEDLTYLEADRPITYSLEKIGEATSNFDDSRRIGSGGYGSVYFGVIGDQEVAIKKMMSTLSKEFYAELKVLCKIHHINVVELLGYATSHDHLYLVYEFVHNGSLSDHLHTPLLTGRPPLSWTARAQIALDSAKGIEYIHDHTKSQYVHRDIKTSNILLDEALRAKVADFGLAKLVQRTNDDNLVATRLVGTPGYLPPESVKELQVTTKTDVFAFGVVLAELITGRRALSRDQNEPNKTKSLITILGDIFQDEDPETALKSIIDHNLNDSYPIEEVCKIAEIAEWCLSEKATNRPEMREIVVVLSEIMLSSLEWEASLGGTSGVFSGLFNGR